MWAGKCKIKPQWYFTTHPLQWLEFKRLAVNRAEGNPGQRGLEHAPGGGGDTAATLTKRSELLMKPSTSSGFLTPQFHSLWNFISKENKSVYVHQMTKKKGQVLTAAFIYNNHNLEAPQVSIKRRTDDKSWYVPTVDERSAVNRHEPLGRQQRGWASRQDAAERSQTQNWP